MDGRWNQISIKCNNAVRSVLGSDGNTADEWESPQVKQQAPRILIKADARGKWEKTLHHVMSSTQTSIIHTVRTPLHAPSVRCRSENNNQS